jgi:hypothetical protein
MSPKPPIPWYWWPVWMALLAAGLFVFYVLFTPVWVGIRLIEWFAHRRETGAGPEREATG